MAAISGSLLAAASLASTVISTGVAVYGQVQQAKAAEDAAEFNAKLAQNEAVLSHQRGIENIRRQRTRNRRYLSRQRALVAGKGISMEGTALQVLGKSAGNLELGIQDAFTDTNIAVNKSISEAKSHKFQGQQAKTASLTSAGGSLLSGAASFGSDAFTFKDTGAI
jgi:hypothetical protein